MSLLDRVREAHQFDPTGLVPFVIDGQLVGYAELLFAAALAEYPNEFRLEDGKLHLATIMRSPKGRTEAVAFVLADLKRRNLVPGWRDELYPVFINPGDDLLQIERATATLFGIRTIAVNLNGYVEKDGEVSIWLQRRAMSKPISPGKLDVLVSGGLPAGGDPFENMVRECHEEAGIEDALARQARYVGTLDFRATRRDGVHHGHYLNYDLSVSETFQPDNQDGEVDDFLLLSAREVMDILSTTRDVAFDSALVIIDFLLRRGIIDPTHPEHDDLCKALYA